MLKATDLPRYAPPWVRRLIVVLLVLIVASCKGGGCAGGCSTCGTTPLPGGFPKSSTIPNSASIRVTRPGLNFLQENLSTLATKALGTSAPGGIASFDIPKSSQSLATICSATTPTPAQCKAEIDLGKAKLRVNSITPNRVKLDGLLPVRIRDLPVTFIGFIPGYVVAGDKLQAPGQDLCTASLRGSATFPFKEFPINVELPLVTENRLPRDGYTKVDVDNAIINIGITEDDVEICSSGIVPQQAFDFVKSFAFDTLIGGVTGQVKTALSSAFCTAPTPTVTPPCPVDSEPDNADLTKATKCVFKNDKTKCVPSLLGLDGRMDLSKALATYSPGSQGNLDFVLASAGDMNPAPGETTLPAWPIPRNPPVPAEDNNKNGISLKMLGGALPAPQSLCVTQVRTPPPQDIPLPKELEGDVITPWPAATPGPHLGFAIAGRFLDHFALAAYNSGVLCLGISTDQVEQLSSGYLSIIVPSIKTLTFEQSPAAAAITTRPGAPPKFKIGNGTDIKTDPLLLISLEKFSIDFYVFSLDRFVRMFTFTADVTVPVNIQTGKDPKTNPNGGILPVIGDIKLANSSVSNEGLLLDEGAAISNGISGLLGGIVGQFLGGGFKPIDVQSALASFGLGLDIPPGGIRKLTSGSDDFLAIFANLQKAAGTAHEQADTRAALVEKIVHPEAMSLTTASRATFPKLRIHAEGIASRPTEQTWWVDQGTHSAWTTERDIVVDQDSMLLQGKHVLYVSSRVVNDMASEDDTPAEIPFVIDTLAPDVDVKHDGNHVKVRARDYVSSESALVTRHRIDGAGWSEWAPLATDASFDAAPKANIDVEVRDEEGNVGRVALPLIRGKADGSLAAAGSGCGCRTAVGSSTSDDGGRSSTFAFAALAFAVAIGASRRSRGARAT